MNASEKRAMITTLNILKAIDSPLSEQVLTVLVETGNCTDSLYYSHYVTAKKIHDAVFESNEDLIRIMRRECRDNK